MLIPPFAFLVVSILLWRWMNAVFMPEVLTSRLLQVLPGAIVAFGSLARQLAFVHFVILYFGAYFAFSFYWVRLKPTFRNPFLGALALLAVNLLILLPLAGRGIFGYRLPQGAVPATVFLLASHWVFARSLQWRT